MKWEYLVLEHAEEYWRTHSPEGGRYPHGLRIINALTGKSPQEVLTMKGEEGWELVQVWERDQSVTKAFCEYSVFWFKRPLQYLPQESTSPELPLSDESKERVLRALSEAIAKGLAPGWELTEPRSED